MYKPAKPQQLIKAIDNFRGKKILVVGDLMLDVAVKGTVDRISPEAPVPIVKGRDDPDTLGGAGNVVNNLVSLASNVFCEGVIGDDNPGKRLREILGEKGVVSRLVEDHSRRTTRKIRLFGEGPGGGGYHQLIRLDWEGLYSNGSCPPISDALIERVMARLSAIVPKVNSVVLPDYNKGVLNSSLSQKIIQLANELNKPVLVDPKPKNIDRFKDCTLLTPNKNEACEIAGLPYDGIGSLEQIAKKIKERVNPKHMIITCGGEGMVIYDNDGFRHAPTKALDVLDVTGAGDTVIATLALAMSSGLPIDTAVELANYAAGIVVGKVGTATISSEELKAYILAHPQNGEK